MQNTAPHPYFRFNSPSSKHHDNTQTTKPNHYHKIKNLQVATTNPYPRNPNPSQTTMQDHQLLRYSRHILLDEIGIEGQNTFLSAHIMVVGCGGLGSAALPYLAAAGIGQLTIADHDTIDTSNLQRQTAYSENDIGQAKVHAMRQRLHAINRDCQIHAIDQQLDATALAQLVPQCDLVLDCSDNFATRQALNTAAVAARKPLVSGAAVRFEGQIAVYRPDLDHSPCYACLFDGETANDGVCALFGVFAPLVGIIGSLQAAEALKILLGDNRQTGILHQYHAQSGQWQTFPIPRDPHCRVCGQAAQSSPS